MRPKGLPVVDPELCNNCGQCVRVCGTDVLVAGERHPTPTGPTPCYVCGHCVAVCPTGAITHPAMNPEHFRELLPWDEGVTAELLLDLLRKRRSVRNYTNQQVPQDVIMRLIEAAVQAPSGLNAQSWHFTIIQDPDRLARIRRRITAIYLCLLHMIDRSLSRLMLRLSVGAQAIEQLEEARPLLERIIASHHSNEDCLLWGAPTLIVVHSPEDDPAGTESAHYAIANLMLMASAMGLGTCVIGFLTVVAERDERLREYLGVPEDHTIDSALVVGYPDIEYLTSVDKRAAAIDFL
ncbi:MAG: nitroreductase family protein [Armatimonadota bacterium]